mgnify:CR=1 FL=1
MNETRTIVLTGCTRGLGRELVGAGKAAFAGRGLAHLVTGTGGAGHGRPKPRRGATDTLATPDMVQDALDQLP